MVDKNEESYKETEEITENIRSFLSVFKSIIPIKYLKSEWSFNQFRIPELKSICLFGRAKNTIFGKKQFYVSCDFKWCFIRRKNHKKEWRTMHKDQ